MSEKKMRFNLRLPTKIYESLRQICFEKKEPISKFITEACEEKLSKIYNNIYSGKKRNQP